jgi:hypothetical protein
MCAGSDTQPHCRGTVDGRSGVGGPVDAESGCDPHTDRPAHRDADGPARPDPDAVSDR